MLRLSEDPSVPVHGWRCIDANDMGRRSGQCEMCGAAVRYVHLPLRLKKEINYPLGDNP